MKPVIGWVLVSAFLLCLAAWITVDYVAIQHWLAYQTGSYNVTGTAHNYNFFSGSGSDLGEATLVTGVAAVVYHAYRRGNCHTHGCWRIGHLPNGDYKVCRKCHRKSTGIQRVDIEHLQGHYKLRLEGKGHDADRV